jgi:hypothetical protein
MWRQKTLEHFGEVVLESDDNLAAFKKVRTVQVNHLSGRKIDFTGTWSKAGAEYCCRLVVRSGPSGEVVWRGKPADAPLRTTKMWGGSAELTGEALQAEEKLPTSERGARCVKVGLYQTAAEALANRSHTDAGDGGVDSGEEVAVAGAIEWSLWCKPSLFSAYQWRKAKEFVSGTFSSSSRRLVLAGTHISASGDGFIGADVYDITIAADGLSFVGCTQDQIQTPDGAWEPALNCQASVLLSQKRNVGTGAV